MNWQLGDTAAPPRSPFHPAQLVTTTMYSEDSQVGIVAGYDDYGNISFRPSSGGPDFWVHASEVRPYLSGRKHTGRAVWLALAAAFVALLVLAAALLILRPQNVAQSPAPKPAAAATTRPAATESSDDLQFDQLIEGNGTPVGATKAARGLAHTVCTSLNDGISFDRVMATGLKQADNGGLSGAQLGNIVGAAVVVYCPAYQSDMSAWTAANGGN